MRNAINVTVTEQRALQLVITVVVVPESSVRAVLAQVSAPVAVKETSSLVTAVPRSASNVE